MTEENNEALSPENVETQPNGIDEEKEEEEVEPEYVCGIAVFLLKEGMGTKIAAISDNVIRQATIEDVLMILDHCLRSVTRKTIASEVIGNLEQMRSRKQLFKGVRH